MKPLQNYIEEEMDKLNNFIGKSPPQMIDNPLLGDTCNFCGQPFDKSPQMEKLRDLLSQSLYRIAKITAEEIVPEKKDKTKFQNDMYDALDDGYNQALSDLQTKIKEFIK